jgi:hypothetical protein
LSADEHLRGATFAPAVPLADPAGRRAGPRGSTWTEDLDLSPGDEVVHDNWRRGVVLAAKGEGSRVQATVDFDSVGKKNQEPPALRHTAATGLSDRRRS